MRCIMDNNFYNILNEIFFNFEENIFVNNGVWPRKVNLIFSFLDYIEALSDAQIADILTTNDANLAIQIYCSTGS